MGEKIRILREVRGFSQEYMADRMGISQAAYSRLESETRELTFERLGQIAHVLEINPMDFLSLDEKFVFNHSINDKGIGIQGYSNNTNHVYNGIPEQERKAYEDKIVLLEELLAAYRKLNKE